ncbi:MAG: ATP-binding protein [Actinomycetota bacterium]
MAQIPMRILVVEDNPGDVRLLQVALAAPGPVRYASEVAASLAETLRLLDRHDYDVLLLDLTLPDSNGIESFRRIHGGRPSLPIVILTVSEDDELALAAVGEGAQDYLVKGHTDASVLPRTLRYAVERQRLVNQLRQMDQARREFIAHAAHELRTPLTTIAGMAAIIERRRGDLDPARFDEMLDAILSQARRAGELARALLDLSQLESGEIRLGIRPTPVADAVRDAVSAAPGGASVSIAVDEASPVYALVDPTRLQQVLVNLVANASRYGDAVWVSARRRDDRVMIVVEDDGPGVPDELVPHLFEPFVRGPDARGEGSGLGLTITRRLVEALGGTIGYEPRDPQGARFVVWFPTADPAQVPAGG